MTPPWEIEQWYTHVIHGLFWLMHHGAAFVKMWPYDI